LSRRRETILAVMVVLIAISPATWTVWADGDNYQDDPALRMGDLYYGEGALDQAITEYKRVLFFSQEGKRDGKNYGETVSAAHARIAACYQAQQRWPQAIFHHRRAIQSANTLGEIEDREFDLITALLASGRDREAELHLLRLRELAALDARKVALYLCVTYTYRGQWSNAAEQLRRAFPSGEIADDRVEKQIEQLELVLEEAQSARRKSPNGAAWLSTVVPGAGQLYAGEPWDALNALAVNAGLVTLICAAVKQEWYLEGAFLFLYPLRRYYLGNRNNARLAAEADNLAVDEQVRQQLLDGILSLVETEDLHQQTTRRTAVP